MNLVFCLNRSTDVSVKSIRLNLNVSANLSSFSCCFISEFFRCLRTCLEESVSTVSSAAMSVLFSSFDLMKKKILLKIKVKYFLLVFVCCFHAWPSFTSHAELTSHAWVLSHIACSPWQSMRWNLPYF